MQVGVKFNARAPAKLYLRKHIEYVSGVNSLKRKRRSVAFGRVQTHVCLRRSVAFGRLDACFLADAEVQPDPCGSCLARARASPLKFSNFQFFGAASMTSVPYMRTYVLPMSQEVFSRSQLCSCC